MTDLEAFQTEWEQLALKYLIRVAVNGDVASFKTILSDSNVSDARAAQIWRDVGRPDIAPQFLTTPEVRAVPIVTTTVALPAVQAQTTLGTLTTEQILNQYGYALSPSVITELQTRGLSLLDIYKQIPWNNTMKQDLDTLLGTYIKQTFGGDRYVVAKVSTDQVELHPLDLNQGENEAKGYALGLNGNLREKAGSNPFRVVLFDKNGNTVRYLLPLVTTVTGPSFAIDPQGLFYLAIGSSITQSYYDAVIGGVRAGGYKTVPAIVTVGNRQLAPAIILP